MKSGVFFSVVIPVYNRTEQMARALDSVLSQTYQNFEIIVVDDGSSQAIAQNIERIVNELNQKRIKLIKHKINVNGAAARNTGIKNASGSYICFLDSDDFWQAEKLSRVQARIEQTNAAVIYHQYVNQRQTNVSKPLPTNPLAENESLAEYMFVSHEKVGIQTSSLVVKSDLAKRVLFNQTLRGHQDWDFTLRLFQQTTNIEFIAEPLSVRVIDGGDNVSGSLDYDFSLAFLNTYGIYFSKRAKAGFFAKVLFNKALKEQKALHAVLSPLFVIALYFERKSLLKSYSCYRLQCKALSLRLTKLLEQVRRNNISSVILFGDNNYTQFVIDSGLPCKIEMCIDSNVAKHGRLVSNVLVTNPNEYLPKIDGSNQWVILMTDKHQQQMKSVVAQLSPLQADKILEF